jgi:hypothetical protein
MCPEYIRLAHEFLNFLLTPADSIGPSPPNSIVDGSGSGVVAASARLSKKVDDGLWKICRLDLIDYL